MALKNVANSGRVMMHYTTQYYHQLLASILCANVVWGLKMLFIIDCHHYNSAFLVSLGRELLESRGWLFFGFLCFVGIIQKICNPNTIGFSYILGLGF